MALSAPRLTAPRWPRGSAGLAAAVVVGLPAAAVVAQAIFGGAAGADAAGQKLLIESALGLVALLLLGGGGAVAIGAAAAWAVSFCAFPGRCAFEWLLVLPLAAPAYVLAYAWGGLAGPAGVMPFTLSGASAAAFVYALAFYPYVYLAARASFATQSVCALEAARSLGASPWASFWRVALPLARPGLIAGGALALMEIAADYGAAAYFGAPTLATGVFHAWYARGEPQLALQLASVLLIAAALLFAVERAARGQRRYGGGSARWRPLPRYVLAPGAAWAVSALLAVVLLCALILPFGYLVRLTVLNGVDLAALAAPLAASVTLASAGAGVTLLLGLALAHAGQRGGGLGRAALAIAGAGYAAPGAVIALGMLSLFALAREAGLAASLTGGAAIAVLIWTYAARFAAAGAQPIAAGLQRLTRSMDSAAATLGANARRRFWAISLPIAAPSVAAAALILFVEILRELPATMILRPFNMDTLAVKAHAYAVDDRLAQAAPFALLIALAGLAPILILSARIGASRPGAAE